MRRGSILLENHLKLTVDKWESVGLQKLTVILAVDIAIEENRTNNVITTHIPHHNVTPTVTAVFSDVISGASTRPNTFNCADLQLPFKWNIASSDQRIQDLGLSFHSRTRKL